MNMETFGYASSYGVFCMTDRMLANGYKIDALDEFGLTLSPSTTSS
jgi:hypothetical protein